MRSKIKLLTLTTGTLLVVAACGSGTEVAGTGGGSGGDGSMTLSIAEPHDGADIAVPFTVELDSSVPLGEPETGEHHVHVFFDGNDGEYILAYGDSVEITEFPVELSPGEHVMNASLRNADHSAAGVETEITLNVGEGGSGSGGSDTGGGGTDPYDYDY